MAPFDYDKESHASSQVAEESNPMAAHPGIPEQPSSDAPVAPAGADETTGASPGTAQACDDLGLNSLAANLERFGIKPPGES